MDQLSSPSANEWMRWLLHLSAPAFITVALVLLTIGARSGRYNFKCILAPAIAFVGVFVLWLGIELQEKFPKALFLENASLGLLIIILGAALVCSVIGLVEYRKEPKHSSKRSGGRYAVITALICGLALSLCLLSLYTKKVYNARNPFKAFTKLKRIRMIDLGFQIYQPSSWIKVDGSHLKPIPTLAFTQIHPSLSFSLLAQKPGPGTPDKIDDLIKLAQSQILSANTSAHFTDPVITSDPNGGSALFESQVAQSVFSFFYVHRVIIYKGFAYQLITWGPSNDPSSVRAGSELMSSSFAVLAR